MPNIWYVTPKPKKTLHLVQFNHLFRIAVSILELFLLKPPTWFVGEAAEEKESHFPHALANTISCNAHILNVRQSRSLCRKRGRERQDSRARQQAAGMLCIL